MAIRSGPIPSMHARVDARQQATQRRDDEELGQRDLKENGTDLQFAVVLHDLEIGRDDVGGRENDEAEAHEQQQNQKSPSRASTLRLRNGRSDR